MGRGEAWDLLGCGDPLGLGAGDRWGEDGAGGSGLY